VSDPTVIREPGRAAGSEVEVLRVAAGAVERAPDAVAVEEPLEIRLNGWRWTITMRTPGDDADLVLGLLASEGAITAASEVETVLFTRHPEEPDLANVADVHLARPLGELRERLERHQVVTSASCGLCGKSTVEALLARRPPLVHGPTIESACLAGLPERLAAAQPVFRTTGGLHAAALFDAAGTLLAAREDVGRHNATDKVLGWRLRAGASADAAVLLVSGRASFEIVQKALVAGIPIVAAVSAPSSLAVTLARSAAMTLVGFVRGGTLNVYAGAERLDPPPDPLAFIPDPVRKALDAVALKISLVDWQALIHAERERLVALAADVRARPEADVGSAAATPAGEAFAGYLRERTVARAGRAPRPLPAGGAKPHA
jgi:FdhD protein